MGAIILEGAGPTYPLPPPPYTHIFPQFLCNFVVGGGGGAIILAGTGPTYPLPLPPSPPHIFFQFLCDFMEGQ